MKKVIFILITLVSITTIAQDNYQGKWSLGAGIANEWYKIASFDFVGNGAYNSVNVNAEINFVRTSLKGYTAKVQLIMRESNPVISASWNYHVMGTELGDVIKFKKVSASVYELYAKSQGGGWGHLSIEMTVTKEQILVVTIPSLTTLESDPDIYEDVVKGGNSAIVSGNLGIGTTTPDEKLDVNGNILIQGYGGGNDSALGTLKFYNNYTSSSSVLAQIQARRGVSSHQKGDLAFYVKDGTNLSESLRIVSNGNVGIGTTTPDEKLAVNGNIHAKEVRVDLVGWPDYVFTKEYNLPSLKDVENHIQENGHLQDIPSTTEVTKNGIMLGEMNAKLLQKIEELTLYTIQQQKEIINLKRKTSKLDQLEKEIQQLKQAFIKPRFNC